MAHSMAVSFSEDIGMGAVSKTGMNWYLKYTYICIDIHVYIYIYKYFFIRMRTYVFIDAIWSIWRVLFVYFFSHPE
jgi:hypothetical protein